MSKSHQKPSSATSIGQSESAQFRHLTPVGQPESVHEISEALYKPFMDGGSTGLKFRITGCSIDPVPFVQLASGEYRLLNGQAVSPEHAMSLGLDNLDQMDDPPAVWAAESRREMYLQNLDKTRFQDKLAEAADGRQWIVWCNHFHGSLSAQSDTSEIEIPFSLWGSRLEKGLDKCPPLKFGPDDQETYQLAADDDGDISDASSIATCAETKRRLCLAKMEKCHSTGHMVDPLALTLCTVRNHLFLKRLQVVCHGCFQSVDPSSLAKQLCSSCRGLQKIKSQDFLADTQLSGLIRVQPWLKQTGRVKLSSQPGYWMLQFQYAPFNKANWRMLFDRETGLVCQVSSSRGWLNGWLRKWENVPQTNWPDFIVR